MRNSDPATSAPACSQSLMQAATVPPVARRSSTITTFCPDAKASSCISSRLVPYSSVYSTTLVESGNLPGLRTGMNPISRRLASKGPKMNPRASGPMIASGFQPTSSIRSMKRFVTIDRRVPSASSGVMSRNIIPSTGKSGTVRTASRNLLIRSSDMLTAPLGEGPGPSGYAVGPRFPVYVVLNQLSPIVSNSQLKVFWSPGPR